MKDQEVVKDPAAFTNHELEAEIARMRKLASQSNSRLAHLVREQKRRKKHGTNAAIRSMGKTA